MSDAAPSNVSRDDFIARARDMIPELRARAREAEDLRRLPDATNAAFHAAGLYRLHQPRRYGGYEMDFHLQIDVAAEIGRGCGSSAWVQSIVASHSWVHGMLGEDAQDEVWGKNPEAVIASASPARGSSVTRVEGGLVVDGRWSFASGVDHCAWTHLNIFVPTEPGKPVQHYFAAVPATDYTIVDDWHVAGMRGTGSKSIDFKQAFVPQHRILDTHACVGGPTLGSALHGGALFRMPLFALFGHGIVGPAVGMALGALDAVVEPMKGRRSAAGVAIADQPTVQVRLAEASGEIEAARGLLKAASDEGTALAAAGVVPPLEQRVRWRRNCAFAAQLCLRAAERLYPLAGANALAEASPFQRAFRDVHAACAHIALTWDVQAANYGGVLLGNPSTDPKL